VRHLRLPRSAWSLGGGRCSRHSVNDRGRRTSVRAVVAYYPYCRDLQHGGQGACIEPDGRPGRSRTSGGLPKSFCATAARHRASGARLSRKRATVSSFRPAPYAKFGSEIVGYNAAADAGGGARGRTIHEPKTDKIIADGGGGYDVGALFGSAFLLSLLRLRHRHDTLHPGRGSGSWAERMPSQRWFFLTHSGHWAQLPVQGVVSPSLHQLSQCRRHMARRSLAAKPPVLNKQRRSPRHIRRSGVPPSAATGPRATAD